MFLYTYSCHRPIFQTLTSLEFLDKVSSSLFLAVQFTFDVSPLFCPFFAICDIVEHRDTDTCTSVGACGNQIKNYITSTFLIIAMYKVQNCELSFLRHLVQSLNSPFFPPLIGAEPGRAKEESRDTAAK